MLQKNTKVVAVRDAKIGDTKKYMLAGVKDTWFIEPSTNGTAGLFYHLAVGYFSSDMSNFAKQEE